MSIWSSVGIGFGSEFVHVMAIENNDDATNYRGEGTPDINVDVATARSWHDRVRLSLWRDAASGVGGFEAEVLLTPDAVRLLRDRLSEALGEKP